jgi:ubiquinone/menaquinone biosynthesis C-methylase UbiE
MDLTDDARANREAWDREATGYQERNADFIGGPDPGWGLWQKSEAELQVLGDVSGLDVLELGCGAAQWAIALARRGARMTGLDNSEVQLGFAREAMAAAGVDFPLVHSSAEEIPLPDASFDVVFCDHGAMTFADPYRSVPEVARLLRPGGLLAFSHIGTIEWLFFDEKTDKTGTELVRDYFGMHRMEESDGMVAFQLPYGEWIRLFRSNGLIVEDLIEVRPDEGAPSTYRDAEATAWARRWPMEQIWRVRKIATNAG